MGPEGMFSCWAHTWYFTLQNSDNSPPNNSHPEQPIIKRKPGGGFSLEADAEYGAVMCTQTH